VIRYLADRIGVMYLGKLVEEGPAHRVYARPLHPHTHGLIATIPMADVHHERAKDSAPLRGELPSAVDPPSGCRFRTRCPLAQQICAEKEPSLAELVPDGHQSRATSRWAAPARDRTDVGLTCPSWTRSPWPVIPSTASASAPCSCPAPA
jgi:oligopeptide/dipeptide ABC transporter ATP-binding protein